MAMESVKWKNKLVRYGYDLTNLNYERSSNLDGSKVEIFTNDITGSSAFLEEDKISFDTAEGELTEFQIERGTYFMNTVVHLLETYGIIKK